MAEWIWDEAVLAGRVWNGVAWMGEWLLNGFKLMAEWIWNGLALITGWTWNGLISTGKLFIPGNFVTDAAVKFYNGYSHSK